SPRPTRSTLFPYTTLFRSSPDRIPVVAITADERERRQLSELAAAGEWELRFAGAVSEALATLQRGKPAVILCDRDLPNLDWRERSEEHTSELQSLRHLVCR